MLASPAHSVSNRFSAKQSSSKANYLMHPGTHLYAVAVICKCGKRHGDFVIGVEADPNSMRSWRNKIAYYQGKTQVVQWR